MRVINTVTNKIVAEFTDKQPKDIDEVIEICGWEMNEWGDYVDGDGNVVGWFLDDYAMVD